MADFPNPYIEESKPPLTASDAVIRLAFYLEAALSFVNVNLTSDEHDALVSVIAAIVRSHPTVVNAFAPSGHVEAPVRTEA